MTGGWDGKGGKGIFIMMHLELLWITTVLHLYIKEINLNEPIQWEGFAVIAHLCALSKLPSLLDMNSVGSVSAQLTADVTSKRT